MTRQAILRVLLNNQVINMIETFISYVLTRLLSRIMSRNYQVALLESLEEGNKRGTRHFINPFHK